ncbi:hypothetical protein C8R48DRAFT_675194 [Suillus tomentosus]|nr:hypothetical protein C8R48DRAFT_675194 [Suillus tomentosus]
MVDSIAYSDSETILALFGFAGLRRLRVDGLKIDKERLLDLRLSLEIFTFSEDILSMRTVLALLHMNWQPSLRSLDVYRMQMSIDFSEQWIATAAEYRDELHSTCAARGIQLNWLPQKNDTALLITRDDPNNLTQYRPSNPVYVTVLPPPFIDSI